MPDPTVTREVGDTPRPEDEEGPEFDHMPGPSIVFVQRDPEADHDHVYEKPPELPGE